MYAEFFTKGLKLTICIPMENSEMFRDWAIVETLEEDIVTLLMSRDELPSEVQLVDGLRFDLRFGKAGAGLRCGGFFAGKGAPGEIKVRLTGEVGTSELREFFRIDAFLPFRYQLSEEQNLDVLIGKWRKRKKKRLEEEAERREAFEEKQRERLFRVAVGELDDDGNEQVKSKERDVEEFNPVDETWDNVNATAMNLSAGGFKFVSSDVFKMDELVIMEIYIPTNPPRIMDCISRVVFKNNNNSIKDGKEYFNVALNFVLIDDRDRDSIVTHISHLESLRIRQKRQMRPVDSRDAKKRISPFILALYIVGLLALIFLIVAYFYEYTHKKEQFGNEIQNTFGDAVRKYREKIGQ